MKEQDYLLIADELGLSPILYKALEIAVNLDKCFEKSNGTFTVRGEKFIDCRYYIKLFCDNSEQSFINFVDVVKYVNFLNMFKDEMHRKVIHAIVTLPQHREVEEVLGLLDDYESKLNKELECEK